MPGPAAPWKAGVSGNPAGRPKGRLTAEIAREARKYGPESIERLVSWMRSDEYKASVPAAIALLDRGYGKPQQEITGEDGGPIDVAVRAAVGLSRMSDEQFDAFDRQLQQAIADGADAGDDAPVDAGGAGTSGSGESP